MSITSTQTPPQFTWLFLVVRRSDTADRPHSEQVTAPDHHSAAASWRVITLPPYRTTTVR
ncbi:host cell division inhibitor Icd-like protein [Erwinia tracheiphila]|uniref:host cell division inhibitor Icd-like protein n=1 Tax=Erwinia tracheiphila TaxID=65700 RepID=UPI001F31B971|nr:host cell division inhibitor Icd-like protein [Erwinia tracheiphila]UIA82977.1 host cell division inhibitor Icd-like protein [Erwinia tracheiphila]UIA91557.1 host cell division inhibitor Icd-like protein [Erwinia tracheiphila]